MQRKAYSLISVTALLVASMGFAQDDPSVQEESQKIQGAQVTGDQVATQSDTKVESKPVVVNSSMNPDSVEPARVDTALRAESSLADDDEDERVETNVKNSSNAGSGVQQIVNVAAQNKTEAELKNGDSQYSSVEDIRRARLRAELRNEGRVLEKLEEGRMYDENGRISAIEGFSTAKAANTVAIENDGSIDTVTVSPVAAAEATTTQQVAQLSAVSDQSMVTITKSDDKQSGSFALTPIGGYRWFQDSINQVYGVKNNFLVGVSLEGRLTSFLAIEGSFVYGQDDIKNRGNGYYGYGNNSQYTSPYGRSNNCYGSYNCGYNNGYNNGYNGSSTLMPTTSTHIPSRRDSYEVAGGLKLGMMTGQVRPYVAGGLGYIHQKYIYSDAYYSDALRNSGLDRSSSNLLGNIGGGLDFAAAKNIGLGARFDYQAMLNKDKNGSNGLDYYYGDSQNRYRLTGNLQIVF